MAGTPSPSDVYNNTQAMHQDSRTPGLNSFIAAWGALQDFTGPWAVNNYNQTINVAALIGGLVT